MTSVSRWGEWDIMLDITRDSRWIVRNGAHHGETVTVLRASASTVKFQVVGGGGRKNKRIYALPRTLFLRRYLYVG